MNEKQSISPERAAALLAVLVPAAARVLVFQQVSDGNGAVARRTRLVPYDSEGRVIELLPVQRSMAVEVVSHLDVELLRPRCLSVPSGVLSPAQVPPVPLWLSPAADPYRLAQLVAQRHELEDDPEPPLLSDGDVSTAADYPDWVPPHTDPAADYAASVAAGHTTPVAWEDAPVCEPVFVERPAEDVPVAGEAL